MNTLKIRGLQIVFFIVLFTQYLNAQQGLGEGTGKPIASPSMASMATYTDVPLNQASGLPDINFPIVNVPIQDENIRYSFNLSYAPVYVDNGNQAAGDVGAGWTLFGGSVIYKKIIGELDERLDNTSLTEYKKNVFDDYYYYNLPGLSGKFQIKRDTINNTFSLINLTPNTVKFEYERENNNATLKINTFTVTDGKGYKFFFNDFDYETIADGNLLVGKGYRSAYMLSKIVSPSGKTLAIFTYDKKSKTTSLTNRLIYQYCKLKTIETDLGKVIFDYLYDESLATTPNDLYSLQKVTLQNSLGQVINSYTFSYVNSIIKEKKRLLTSISKNDRNGVKIEQTSFVYNQQFIFPPAGGSSVCDWGGSVEQSYYDNYKVTNILEKIITPSGGVKKYEYASHDYFFNYDQTYLDSILNGYIDSKAQYVQSQPETQFDTSQTSTYTFTISGDPNKKIAFNIYGFIVDGYHDGDEPIIENPLHPKPVKPFSTDYKIKSSTGEYLNYRGCILGSNSLSDRVFYGYPGTYTMEVTSVGKGYGFFTVSEIKFFPLPLRNSKYVNAPSPRLKTLTYYNSINDTQPVKKINYNYDTEDGSGSSGYIFYSDSDDEFSASEIFVLYKNIKVSEDQTGYTRFSYIIPEDYPKYQNGGNQLYPTYFYPYYNITKGGLLSDKKVYNDQNQLLASEKYTYAFEDYISDTYQFYINNSPYTSKPTYVKKANANIKSFMNNGGIIENINETVINKFNLKPSYIKETSADGTIRDKQFLYPSAASGYAHLENAYIISDPIQTITKNNGKVISNTQLKYDNNKFQPTSALSINPNDGSLKTAIRYDDYDVQGNLRQYTAVGDESTGKGVTTTVIWGYNNTMPIAEVKGASLSDIGSLADTIIAKSNLDVDATSETELINALDLFRTNPALKNFQITTYTYDPLIGVTTLTPPNGMREIYRYDQQNKLKSVVNVNGNILKEYKYNIKQP